MWVAWGPWSACQRGLVAGITLTSPLGGSGLCSKAPAPCALASFATLLLPVPKSRTYMDGVSRQQGWGRWVGLDSAWWCPGNLGFGEVKRDIELPRRVYPSLLSVPSSSSGDSPGMRSTAGRQGNPKGNSAPATSSKQRRMRSIWKTSAPRLAMWETVCWGHSSGSEPLRSGSQGRAQQLCRMVPLATTGTRWPLGTRIPEPRLSLLQAQLQRRQIESVVCARPAL